MLYAAFASFLCSLLLVFEGKSFRFIFLKAATLTRHILLENKETNGLFNVF